MLTASGSIPYDVRSLTALGRVIEALGKNSKHVPYRDSTLTMLLRGSFAGRSSTSVVISVAGAPLRSALVSALPDVPYLTSTFFPCYLTHIVTMAGELEHIEETNCSLAFGARLAVVQNGTTKATAREVGSGGGVEAALARAKGELSALEAAGKGPRFGHTAEPSQVKAFQESQRKLEQLESEIRSLQVEVQEARAGSGGGSSSRGMLTGFSSAERMAGLQGQARQLRQNIANSKTAVDRLTKEK